MPADPMAALKKTGNNHRARKTSSAGSSLGAAIESAALRQASIARAKLEWESTVDALASLVCLLGRGGRVLRANRVVEDWGIGKVKGVIGRDIHSILHPTCRNSRCDLVAFVRNALQAIQTGTRTPFELHLALPNRALNITMMPMRLAEGTNAELGDTLAVLVADDVSALLRVQDALERLNVTLEGRVRSRTQALAHANLDLRNEVIRREMAEQQLRTSRDELAVLSAQLIRAQEGERKRISQELHDSVGQSLSAAKYTVERGLELLRNPESGDSSAVFELAVRRIQEAGESIRTISMDLRPAILDDLGAASALQWFCRDFAEIYPALAVSADLSVTDREVPERLTTVVYRCTQELLNNVVKHAGAKSVHLSLTRFNDVLELQVRDDGVGVEGATSDARRRGSGLRNLRERAQMTGGAFSIVPAPGSGTLAQLSWPLPESERASVRKRKSKKKS